MRKEERLMLSLLRAALWGEPLPAKNQKPAVWSSVLRLSERQAIHGLVAKMIVRMSEEHDMPSPDDGIVSESLSVQFAMLRSNMHVNHVLQEVVEILRHNGMEPLLLKGQGVAQCYDYPELRMPGDIDLYLTDVDVDAAASVLRRRYPEAVFSDAHPKHAMMEIDGVEIELHRYLGDKNLPHVHELLELLTIREMSSERHGEVIIGNMSIHIPSAMLNAVFLFCHFRMHYFNNGIGLRQLCDWVLFLHHHYQEILLSAKLLPSIKIRADIYVWCQPFWLSLLSPNKYKYNHGQKYTFFRTAGVWSADKIARP